MISHYRLLFKWKLEISVYRKIIIVFFLHPTYNYNIISTFVELKPKTILFFKYFYLSSLFIYEINYLYQAYIFHIQIIL